MHPLLGPMVMCCPLCENKKKSVTTMPSLRTCTDHHKMFVCFPDCLGLIMLNSLLCFASLAMFRERTLLINFGRKLTFLTDNFVFHIAASFLTPVYALAYSVARAYVIRLICFTKHASASRKQRSLIFSSKQ